MFEKIIIKKAHKKELTTEKKNFFENIKEYQRSNQSFFSKLAMWLLSGIPGIVSSTFLVCLFIGASVLLVPENTRQDVFIKLATEYLGIKKP